jgi:hypothetical protein
VYVDVRLDLKTNQWEELPQQKDTPSARSGHRMVVYRNFLLLFGGFYEVNVYSLYMFTRCVLTAMLLWVTVLHTRCPRRVCARLSFYLRSPVCLRLSVCL